MYRKSITYTDYDGQNKTKNYYFNMTRPELIEMKTSPLFEMQNILDRISRMDDPDVELSYAEKDDIQETLGEILRNLVIQSYGVKSDDGERFIKRIGNRRFGYGEDFTETMAYESLYMEMIGDINNFINFVRAIIPDDVRMNLDNSDEYKAYVEAAESVEESTGPKLIETTAQS